MTTGSGSYLLSDALPRAIPGSFAAQGEGKTTVEIGIPSRLSWRDQANDCRDDTRSLVQKSRTHFQLNDGSLLHELPPESSQTFLTERCRTFARTVAGLIPTSVSPVRSVVHGDPSLKERAVAVRMMPGRSLFPKSGPCRYPGQRPAWDHSMICSEEDLFREVHCY
jgi:hypothetical protein